MLKAIERMTRQAIPVMALPAELPVMASHQTPAGHREDDRGPRPQRHAKPQQRQGRRNGHAQQGQAQRQDQAQHNGQKHPGPKPHRKGNGQQANGHQATRGGAQKPRHQAPQRSDGGGNGLAGLSFLRAAAPRGQDR